MLRVLVARSRLGVHVLFKDLTWTKRDHATGSDANLFTGSRITSFTGPFTANDKIPKSRNFNCITLLQHFLQQIEHEFDDISCIVLRHSNLLEDFVRDIRLSHAFPPAIH